MFIGPGANLGDWLALDFGLVGSGGDTLDRSDIVFESYGNRDLLVRVGDVASLGVDVCLDSGLVDHSGDGICLGLTDSVRILDSLSKVLMDCAGVRVTLELLTFVRYAFLVLGQGMTVVLGTLVTVVQGTKEVLVEVKVVHVDPVWVMVL